MPLVLRNEDFHIDYILQQSHNKIFEDYILIKIPSRRFEVIQVAKDKTSIKLIDKNQFDLLSVVNGAITSYHNKEYFEISGTYSKNQGRGYMTYLFKFIEYVDRLD